MVKIPNLEYEKSIIPGGCRYVLGIDEVGRGPWAGPVSVGAFLLDIKNFDLEFFQKNIRDSKKIIEKKRQSVFKEIQNKEYSYKVVSTSSAEIDSDGIQKVIQKSVENLITQFTGRFDFVIVDGNFKIDITKNFISIPKADSNCFSVAAASICAKVIRDDEMIKMNELYPGYDFANNKGYGTASHILGLQKLGPCPIHRYSYKPIGKFFEAYSSAK